MTITLDAITLPADLQWTDELSWSPVAQTVERSVDGRQLIQAGTLVEGRPITLASNGAAWFDRSTLVALQATMTPDATFTLTIHGQPFTVAWDHEQGAMEPDEVMRQGNPGDNHKYTATLRFITVAGA